MAYTVKEVASMSGISVRTLHFYDETDLLKPASYGANGYRYYEEPQLLMLQQILFYRELGFGLKKIKEILGRPEFATVDALESHRKVLQKNVARTRRLIATIDRTLDHLKGRTTMQSEEMFAGFNVAAGKDRFGEHVLLGGEPNDCKVSARDTGGAMSIFEFTGSGGGPRHLHHGQDEWIYVLDGEVELHIGEQQLRLGPGESAFVPREVPHVWVFAGGGPGRILNVYQPAGAMEEFFRELGTHVETPVHEALSIDGLRQLFQSHGMKLVGPPLYWEEYLAGR
ncbi:cupin domain-containing protein [Longimicrobium sp.]|jgi:DNA-binding transcriptional MerR regulator/quercetin dioxygenase-like cupin family protein|uniref:cupin domain-containing protein n=1 Tax=Longimicrobium sp. TaxID=2029185 RepID=UPI002EDB6A71